MHVKAFRAGNKALGLWVRAGSWSMQQLTDGHIPTGVVQALGGDWDDAASLVNAGLWHAADDGYQFHDWAEYQPTRAQVEAERAKTRERVEKHRASKRSNTAGNAVTNGVGTGAPSRPVPTPDTTYVIESQSLDNRARETTDELSAFQRRLAAQSGLDNVEKIRDHIFEKLRLTLSLNDTIVVSNWILAKPKTAPDYPQQYVLGSITRSPAEVEKYIHEAGLA